MISGFIKRSEFIYYALPLAKLIRSNPYFLGDLNGQNYRYHQSMVISGYNIQEQIGRGGMSTVYLAIQESLNRPVALKILANPNVPGFSERFISEGRMIASLDHPNIVNIYDIGIDNDQHFLSMEYVTGGDLASRIADKIPPPTVLNIIEKIGGALQAAHDKGIVHRDVKPSNIMFRNDGTPLLMDFGIAKQSYRDQELTATGAIIGTPYYMSPEQAQSKPLDGRADLYSLGIVLYEMLMGQKPYQGESDINVIFKHMHDPLPILPQELHWLQPLLNNMIAKPKEDRFQSLAKMVEFAEDLHRSDPSVTIQRAPSKEIQPPSVSESNTKQINAQPATLRPYPGKLWPIPRLFLIIAGIGILVIFTLQLMPANDPDNIPKFVENAKNNKSEDSKRTNVQTGQIEWARDNAESSSSKRMSIATSNEELTNYQQTEAGQSVTPSQTDINNSQNTQTVTREPQDTVDSNQISRAVPLSNGASSKTTQIAGVDSAKRIGNANALIVLAEERLKEHKLSTPKNDNALYYYNEARKLDPDNSKAWYGYRKVASQYARLAENELSRKRYTQAESYVERGLEIDPENRKLKVLKGKVEVYITSRRVKMSAKKFVNDIKRKFKKEQ